MGEQEGKTEANRLQIQVHKIQNIQEELHCCSLKVHLLQHK